MSKGVILILLYLVQAIGSYTPYRAIIDGDLMLGMHWVDIKVGTPSQDVRMHIDTGSNLMIIEGSSCSTCRFYYHGYDSLTSLNASSIGCTSSLCSENSCNSRCFYRNYCNNGKCCARTASSLCGFYVTYGDGSQAEGGLWRDYIGLVGENATVSESIFSTFGVINKESGTWDSSTDGLLGLAYNDLYCSPSCYNTWIDDYYAAEKAKGAEDVFTMCFGAGKGILSIGGLDDSLYKSPIYWTDLESSTYYEIEVNAMQVGEAIFPISNKISAIVDSGTTIMYVPNAIWKQFMLSMIKKYPTLPGVTSNPNFFSGYGLRINPMSWPSLNITIGSIIISIPPSIYFIKLNEDGYIYYYLGISGIDNSYVLLGDTFMRGLSIIHDRKNDRLGFAVPTLDCYITFYSIINGIDPYSDQPNPTDKAPTDAPTSPAVSTLLSTIFDYGLEIFICLVVCIILCVVIKPKRKSMPLRVARESRERLGIPYKKGFQEKRSTSALAMATIPAEAPPERKPDPLPIIVVNRPIYIPPVAPPKPK